MADRYLLESGAPDGYLLEDGTGVYLLETPPASPITQSGQITPTNLIARPSIQGGYSTGPNLLITTLALFAAASTQRAPVANSRPVTPAVQAFQAPNLLTSTLAGQVVIPIPPGQQSIESAPGTPYIPDVDPVRNGVILDVAPPAVAPIGQQRTESAPRTPSVLLWDRGSNTLLFTTPPAGEQRTESAPSVTQYQVSPQGVNLELFGPVTAVPIPPGEQKTDSAPYVVRIGSMLYSRGADAVIPIAPLGEQRTDSAPYALPRLTIDQPRNLLAQFPPSTTQPIPPGKQETDSAPIAPRIGSIIFARGVDPAAFVAPVGEQRTDSAPYALPRLRVDQPGNLLAQFPPPTSAALPPGEQRTDSAPSTSQQTTVDQFPNLLGSAFGLQPIASAQSEWLPTLSPASVYLWLAPNVTINLPIAAQAIPPGQQHTESAPAWTTPVQSFTAPVIVPPVIIPLPIGRQQTDSATPLPPQVQGYEAPNAALFIPPPDALPAGQQWSASAPIINTDVWSQNSTIPPDLLPPPAPAPTIVIDTHDGGRKKKHKRDLVEEKRLAQERLRAQLTALVDPKPLTEVIEQTAEAVPVFKESPKPVILPALPVEDDDEEDILKLLMSYYEIPRRILP